MLACTTNNCVMFPNCNLSNSLDVLCLYRWGCHYIVQPYGKPFLCQKEPHILHLRTIECCSDSNYCNQLLNPSLGPVPVEPGNTPARTSARWTD